MLVALFLFLYTLLFFSAHIYCMHCLICTNFWSYCSYPFLGPTFFLLSRGKLLQTKIQNSKLGLFVPKRKLEILYFFIFLYSAFFRIPLFLRISQKGNLRFYIFSFSAFFPLFSGFRPKRKLEILYFFIFRFFSDSAFLRILMISWFPIFFIFTFLTFFSFYVFLSFWILVWKTSNKFYKVNLNNIIIIILIKMIVKIPRKYI